MNLGGTLNVSLINSFTPLAGNSFDIMDWGSLTGKFSALQLPILNNGPLGWDTSHLYTTGVLSVTATVLGDFNRDGLVTTADIAAQMAALANMSGYQSANGLSNQQFLEIADINGDGRIDNTDVQALINLVANNEASGGSGLLTAVPEPAAIVLLGIGTIAIAFCRRSRKTLAKRRHRVAAQNVGPFSCRCGNDY